jgi:GxxExxY protein
VTIIESRGAAEDAEAANPVALDDVTGAIIDAALKIHQEIGPGLLESVYECILQRELRRRGLRVDRQKTIAFDFDGMHFDDGLKADLMVNDAVVVDLKSVETLLPVHKKQVLTYLRLLHRPVGLLINFGAPTLKEGLHRIVNKLPASASPRLRVNQS